MIVLINEVNRANYGRLLLHLRMQHGGTDVDMGTERHGTENGVETARSEPDAAATRKEAANLAVAAMSRRVSGGRRTIGQAGRGLMSGSLSHSSSVRRVERATGYMRGRGQWRLPSTRWSGYWRKRGGGASGTVLGWRAMAKKRAEEG